MYEYLSIIYCVMDTMMEWHFKLTTITGVLTDLYIFFCSSATWLVSFCTLQCNDIKNLSNSLTSWTMYSVIISFSCSTLYNISVPWDDVRRCVWNLLIGVTDASPIFLWRYPIPPCQCEMIIDVFINVVFRGNYLSMFVVCKWNIYVDIILHAGAIIYVATSYICRH